MAGFGITRADPAVVTHPGCGLVAPAHTRECGEQMYVIQTWVRYTRTPGLAPVPSSPLGRGSRRRRSDAHPAVRGSGDAARRHGEAVIRSGDAWRYRGLPTGSRSWITGSPREGCRGRVSILAAASGASGRLTLLQALVAVASRERTAVYLDLVGSLDPGFLATSGLTSAPAGAPAALRGAGGGVLHGSEPGGGRRALAGRRAGLALQCRVEHRLSTLVESVAARRAVCLVSAASPLPLAWGTPPP